MRAALDVLEVPARLETPEALLVHGRPVFEAAEHVADVDVVEGVVGEGPGLFGSVVELELAVGGDPGGLCGGEVDSGDRGAGEFVGEIPGGSLC